MWKVGVQGRKTKCGVFGWDAPHNLRHLNTWSVLAAAWAGLGGIMLLEKVYHRAEVLRIQKIQVCSVSFLFPAYCSRRETLASLTASG